MTEISIIVPIYNEEENIKSFLQRTEKILDKIGKSYEIIFALDPSLDNSENIILEEIKRNKNIKLLIFSRQFGQTAASMAGISNCKGSYCVTIDVDLQDPPEIIENLYNKIISGYEVVYAKRKSRKGETFLKKLISSIKLSCIKDFTISAPPSISKEVTPSLPKTSNISAKSNL